MSSYDQEQLEVKKAFNHKGHNGHGGKGSRPVTAVSVVSFVVEAVLTHQRRTINTRCERNVISSGILQMLLFLLAVFALFAVQFFHSFGWSRLGPLPFAQRRACQLIPRLQA